MYGYIGLKKNKLQIAYTLLSAKLFLQQTNHKTLIDLLVDMHNSLQINSSQYLKRLLRTTVTSRLIFLN